MVATLVRLRLRILLNTVAKDTWRLIFLILGLLYAAGAVLVIALGAWALALTGFDLATAAIAFGVVLTIAWVIVPVLSFGLDDTLDPARFAQFTAPSMPLAIGLVIGGAITVPGIFTVGMLLALTLAWVTSAAAIPAWLVAAGIGLATCLVLARVATTAAATFLRSRRGKDIMALVGAVLLLGVVLVPNLAEGADVATIWEQLQPGLWVLAWTPFGAAWAIPGAVTAGSYGWAVVYLAVALAWLTLISYAWLRLLTPAMTNVAHARVATQRGDGLGKTAEGLHQRLRLPIPAAAVAARALKHWRSDPRYVMQALTIFLLPVLLGLGLSVVQEVPSFILLLIPIGAAFFAGWALHNDTAYDSTAVWMFISSGMSGRDDRLGRLVGMMIWAIPALVVLTVIPIVVLDYWELAPALLGVSLAIFGGGLGFCLALSGGVVYPVQPPGVSPFSTTGMGALGYTMLIQSGAALATGALAIPAAIPGLLAYAVNPAWGWLSLALGLITVVVVPWIGTRQGGRLLEKRAKGMLATIGTWEGH